MNIIAITLSIVLSIISLSVNASGLKDQWDVHESTATATAKASHQFNPSEDKLQLSLAYGQYDYADAMDFAFGYKLNEYSFITGNIGETGDQYAVGVAITFVLF